MRKAKKSTQYWISTIQDTSDIVVAVPFSNLENALVIGIIECSADSPFKAVPIWGGQKKAKVFDNIVEALEFLINNEGLDKHRINKVMES